MTELSMSETTTFRWSFEEDVERYAGGGNSRHRHLAAKTLRLRPGEGARSARPAAGLKVSHLFWAGGFTGSDGRSYRESIEDAAEAVRTAAALDCRTLVLYSGPRAGHTYNHARRLVQAALDELAPLAAELEVTLAIEPMHPGCAAEWTFLTSLDMTLDLLETVASPQVKMVLDTYHLGLQGGLPGRIAEIVPQIAIVQLGDARRPPNGEQNRCRLGRGHRAAGRDHRRAESRRLRRLLRRRIARRRGRGRRLPLVAGTREGGVRAIGG